MSVNDNDRVLAERARALARPARAPVEMELVRILAFEVGGAAYALPAERVLAVVAAAALTPLPRGRGERRAAAAALTPWRGDLLTVADLAALLGLPPSPLSGGALVVVDAAGGPRGLLVQRLRDVVHVAPADIQPVPDATGGVVGHVRSAGGAALLLLDPGAVLGEQPSPTERNG